MDDIFDLMHGDDGYRVEQVALGEAVIALHVGIKQHGCFTTFVTASGEERSGADAAPELFRWPCPTFADRGECDRLYHFLSASVRFLNTGGTWEQMITALHRLRQFAFGPPMVFDGYTFRQSSINTEGDWEHVFLANNERSDGRDVVVWYEDSFIDRCTLAEYESVKSGMDSDGQHDGQPNEPDEERSDGGGTGEG